MRLLLLVAFVLGSCGPAHSWSDQTYAAVNGIAHLIRTLDDRSNAHFHDDVHRDTVVQRYGPLLDVEVRAYRRLLDTEHAVDGAVKNGQAKCDIKSLLADLAIQTASFVRVAETLDIQTPENSEATIALAQSVLTVEFQECP